MATWLYGHKLIERSRKMHVVTIDEPPWIDHFITVVDKLFGIHVLIPILNIRKTRPISLIRNSNLSQSCNAIAPLIRNAQKLNKVLFDCSMHSAQYRFSLALIVCAVCIPALMFVPVCVVSHALCSIRVFRFVATICICNEWLCLRTLCASAGCSDGLPGRYLRRV